MARSSASTQVWPLNMEKPVLLVPLHEIELTVHQLDEEQVELLESAVLLPVPMGSGDEKGAVRHGGLLRGCDAMLSTIPRRVQGVLQIRYW